MIAQRLTRRIEASAVKRIEFSTEIVETDGGHEHRDRRRTYPKAEWDIVVPDQKRNAADYLTTRALFMAAGGAWESWLFHDHDDCAFEDEPMVELTATTFQVSKTYSVASTDFVRRITRPISPLVVKVLGVTQVAGYNVDYHTGVVTFDDPPAATPTGTGKFDVPVRFKDDTLELAGNGSLASIRFTAREVYEA